MTCRPKMKILILMVFLALHVADSREDESRTAADFRYNVDRPVIPLEGFRLGINQYSTKTDPRELAAETEDGVSIESSYEKSGTEKNHHSGSVDAEKGTKETKSNHFAGVKAAKPNASSEAGTEGVAIILLSSTNAQSSEPKSNTSSESNSSDRISRLALDSISFLDQEEASSESEPLAPESFPSVDGTEFPAPGRHSPVKYSLKNILTRSRSVHDSLEIPVPERHSSVEHSLKSTLSRSRSVHDSLEMPVPERHSSVEHSLTTTVTRSRSVHDSLEFVQGDVPWESLGSQSEGASRSSGSRLGQANDGDVEGLEVTADEHRGRVEPTWDEKPRAHVPVYPGGETVGSWDGSTTTAFQRSKEGESGAVDSVVSELASRTRFRHGSGAVLDDSGFGDGDLIENAPGDSSERERVRQELSIQSVKEAPRGRFKQSRGSEE